MNVVFVLFDSLNRHVLPPYGGSAVAPNFSRLAEKAVSFDTSYVCSMPCIPARRDLLTGRPGFLHRGWGPVEPYDVTFPELLRAGGVKSHLISDHGHYWEEGGSNYHTKFNTWEIVRGQEGDPWIPWVTPPERPDSIARRDAPAFVQDFVNREAMPEPHMQPMSRVFTQARRFLERHHTEENWFLQIETFDPHEPFFTHRRYKDLYADHYRKYSGKPFDWPPYRQVEESPEEVEHLRHEYAALVSMCDEKLGDILDQMDRLNLWEDTMLIVGTDHGFLLGEHDCWAKCWMPFYEEIARTPFFVWDPRSEKSGERRQALVQPAIDFAPTVLGFFGLDKSPAMTGFDLKETVANDQSVRDSALFGMFGAHVNVTDGRYVYMRGNPPGQENAPLFDYTLMPVFMRKAFGIEKFSQPLESATFDFTRGCHLMKLPSLGGMPGGEPMNSRFEHLLFDLATDPGQEHPLVDADLEGRFCELLHQHLLALDAPSEQWHRLGLTQNLQSGSKNS